MSSNTNNTSGDFFLDHSTPEYDFYQIPLNWNSLDDDYLVKVEENLTSFFTNNYKELTKKLNTNSYRRLGKNDRIDTLVMESSYIMYCFRQLIKMVSKSENVNSNTLTPTLFKVYGMEPNKNIFQFMTYDSHFNVFKDHLLTGMSQTLHKVSYPTDVDDFLDNIPVMLNTMQFSQIQFHSLFPLYIVWSHMGSLIKKLEESV